MLCVFAYCAKDKAQAVRLATWINELGGVKNHDCLIGVHTDSESHGVIEILRSAFNRVAAIPIDDTGTIYPYIANMMWKGCAQFIADWSESQPWLWIEPDAVPLVPEWLDRIESEYRSAGKPFMLDKVVTPSSVHNSGVGVYPARVRDYTTQLWNLANIPWDVFFKEDFTPHTKHTELIHDKFYQVWGNHESGAPVFPDAESLSAIESAAVLFHRNKDGSLMERLKERGGFTPSEPPKPAETPDSKPDQPSLLARIEALEAAVFHACTNGAAASAPAKSGDRVVMVPSLKPSPQRRGKAMKPRRDTRTPEQIQADKERMALARAGRKAVTV